MKRYWNYFKYVMKHKYYVFLSGLKFGIPITRLLLHDISKLYPCEFIPYAKNFYNEDGSKKDIRNSSGAYNPNEQSADFKEAWNHHQKNKHHWQAWVSIGNKGELFATDIPNTYLEEMVADWLGAAKANGNFDDLAAFVWYEKNKEDLLLSKKSINRLQFILHLHGTRYVEKYIEKRKKIEERSNNINALSTNRTKSAKIKITKKSEKKNKI